MHHLAESKSLLSAAPQLVLASTSRYRKELLSRLNLPFSVLAPGVDETPETNEVPKALALRLSLAKARAVARAVARTLETDVTRQPNLIKTDCIIIGSDQTATLDGMNLIGKPETHRNAIIQLRNASGKSVTFHSGLAILRPATGFEQVLSVDTEVTFRDLTDEQIEAYLLAEKPYDCTGSAKIESLGIALVKNVSSSDPTALIGLPMIALCTMLQAAGLEILGHRQNTSLST